MINEMRSLGLYYYYIVFIRWRDITYFFFFTPIVFYYNGLEMMMAISMKFYRLEYMKSFYITFKPKELGGKKN